MAERVFGWGRGTVQLGLEEKRTGILCQGAQATYCGNQLWEEKHPEVAAALWKLAEEHSQQDPTFRSSISYTRLTAAEALQQLREQGFGKEQLPSPSTMADVLNRNGYRLRKVVKAKPQKKIPETDAIFANLQEQDGKPLDGVVCGQVKRLSMDCKATVKIGEYARGGKTRGDCQAADHDMGGKKQHVPFGIVDEDGGELYLTFGSSYKTSDFLVDSLIGWWNHLPAEERATIAYIQIKADNGPESSGVRTQFLKRIVDFTDFTGLPIRLLYYPPYHSKYNPIERCWGILEQHWNGSKLESTQTMLEWAKSMTWKGIKPVVNLCKKMYKKGISLSRKAMQEIESRLERNPLLPKWDILIRPS